MFGILGPLYSWSSYKGKASLFILISCKLLLPAFLVVSSDRSESESFHSTMKLYYKNKMEDYCILHNEIPFQNFSSKHFLIKSGLKRSERISSGDTQSLLENFTTFYESSQSNSLDGFDLIMDFYNRAKLFNERRTGFKIPSKKCCDVFKNILMNKTKCLDDHTMKTSSLSFSIGMFLPAMGVLLSITIIAIVQQCQKLQFKLLRWKYKNSSFLLEEMSKERQIAIHLIMDVLMFWAVVFKFWLLSCALISCRINKSICTPKYSSYQLAYLIFSSQTPWMSFLLGFMFMKENSS